MEIIDFHAHIYPEKIAKKAAESIGEFYKIDMSGLGTAENLIKSGSKAGITGYTVHSVAVDAAHVETINNYIASECETHPEFYGFGTMHADYEDKISEAERIKSLGLLGVKLHPDTQKYNMDDPRMFEFYDYLAENHLPVLIHCGDYRYDYSHPARLKNILRKFPNLTVIGAHFGGWSVYDLAVEYLLDENCYLDCSSSFQMLGLKRGRELIKMYGAERMLFGSDFPMWDPAHELDVFLSMGFSNEEYELMLCENAKRILFDKK